MLTQGRKDNPHRAAAKLEAHHGLKYDSLKINFKYAKPQISNPD